CVKRSEIYCHTEAFEGEVSNVEFKQDFSPFSKAQNDKFLDSLPTNHANKTTNSSSCSMALEALSELEGRSYLSDNDYPSNSLNRSNCIDKGEFLQNLDSVKSKTPTAEVSLSDFSGFTKESKAFGAEGEGSYLEGNDQALSEQSAKSAKKTTQNLDSKTHKSLKQLTLFFCIGGGITLAELAGFYILYKFFGVHYILASLIMFVLASGVGVWLYRRFVFGETHLHRGLEVGLTYLINTIGIGLNTLILWVCVEFLGFEAIVAKILASLLVAFYGFYARKLVIYRKEPKFYFYTKSPAPAHKGVDSKFIKKECQ
ncbi:GtrA family protein, partial [Helicobacter bilis]